MIKNLKIEFSIFGILLLSILLSDSIGISLYKIFNDFCNSPNNRYFKEFFINITELGNSLWYFLIALIFFVFSFFIKKKTNKKYEIFYKKLKIDSIFFFLAIVVTGFLTQIIKHALGRPRPNYSIIENNLGFDFFSLNSSFHSFPSGHTSTIFVVALCFSLLLPKIRYFFIFFASIIAFSRVVVGAHFFTDIVGGIVVAYIGFKITIFLFNKLNIESPLSSLKKLNSNHVFLALLIFFIIVLFLAIGSSIDIYISSLFYLGKQKFVLQSYFILTVIFRKIFIPLIVLYLMVLPIISIFLPIEKFYFNFKLKSKEVWFIFGSVFFNLLIFVNLILKNMWGRARPNDILQLGGKENFSPWFELSSACNTNCSFVSGDAAVGFSLIILFFITKNKIFFWGSLVAGLSIGLIRILEGGHFFSDVIMSGLIVYLLTSVQFYFFKKKYAD